MSNTRNIVIIGASFGGLSTAHYFLKNTLSTLKSSQPDTAYRIVLVDQSSHFFWRIAAPRAAVSTTLIPHSQLFIPITDAFKTYPSESFVFHHGTAESINTTGRTVTVKSATSGEQESISYHALVIASGILTPTVLTSLHGNYTDSQAALDAMNVRIAKARDVIIGGGGPVGVETAGEVGEALNGAAGWFQTRPTHTKAKVTLVTSGAKLLPVMRQSLSDKAEKYLNRVGVDVVYNKRVEKAEEPAEEGGKTKVHLSDGSVLEADVYIPGTGATPNTAFIPHELLDGDGRVQTDTHLRVKGAGERVYCVGDVGNHSRGGVLNIQSAIPVLMANMAYDLGGSKKGVEKEFKPDTSESQIVPVGRNKGVGAIKGVQMPSVTVWAFKGRDYMTSMKGGWTHGGMW